MVHPVLMYIDLIWLPAGLFAVHKGQRLMTVAFVLSCSLFMRLQVELLGSMGYTDQSILNLMQSRPYFRALIIYSVFIAIFLVLAHFSPNTKGVIYLAACLSILVIALVVSTVFMVI